MTVTFCGHSYYQQSTEDESIVLSLLNERCAGADIEFFLGEYGEFDRFAYGCAKKFKKNASFCQADLRVALSWQRKNERHDRAASKTL